jgi:hypothetical protein
MTGSLHLSEYSAELVRLSCAKCGCAGQYRKQNLIHRYGADVRLPDLREEIAQCERRGPCVTLRDVLAAALRRATSDTASDSA